MQSFYIKNKLNIIPIAVNALWTLFVLYYFLFRIQAITLKTAFEGGLMVLGLPLLSIAIFLFFLALVAGLNLYSQKKFYCDFIFISGPFSILLVTFLLFFFL